jgi:ferric-dicitrate binding protein FerR (iron transport regulator)
MIPFDHLLANVNGNYNASDEDYIIDLFGNKENEEKIKAHLHRQFYELISNEASENKDLENILHRVHYVINTYAQGPNKRSRLNLIVKWTARIAAILILPLCIYSAIHFLNNSKNEKESWVEINAPAWTRAQFSLPDGTTGWLNSNSSLKYKGSFINKRQVNLTGEAFFDVNHDKHRPFIVKADEVFLTVLGTKFNIASYENENEVEVVLKEGELIFNNKERDQAFTMKPNDMVVYNKSHKDLSVEVVQPQKFLSWTEGKLVFRNDPIDVVARRLERWYNINVEVDGDFSDELRLRATFKDESLREVLGLMQRSLNVKCQIKERNLNSDGSYSKTKVIITHENQ